LVVGLFLKTTLSCAINTSPGSVDTAAADPGRKKNRLAFRVSGGILGSKA